MEVPMPQKRDAIEMCHKLIPMMNGEELSLIGIALNTIVERLIKEGRVTEE